VSAPVILASGSQIRRQILASAGVAFDVQTSHVDEDAIKREAGSADPDALALKLAEAKALAVSAHHPDRLVLGGDQILSMEGSLYDKVASRAEARARLLTFRGRSHTLHAGLAAARAGQIIWRHSDASHLAMRDFSEAFLDDYLARAGDELTASVGCYAYEGLGAQLFDRVEGNYYSILGLPLLPVLDLLRREGLIAS
tara:strand:- start:81 stop:674 length:594 start_codon:yes stop_codon:yes gene_type:complete